ncbi:MAG TPA: hypothetical protein ENK59_00825 [Thioploca sp.]|nr:hypothetical protein [Thioploca sp.]
MQLFIKVILLTIVLIVSVFAAEEKKYYDNGSVQFEYSYRSGQLHGLTKEYYETGELKAEHEYRSGKLISKRRFRRNGDLEYELKYEDGQKIEYKIEYYPTGERFRQRTLINGKREGLEIEFHRNGKKKAERNYIADKKEGSAKGYYINGRLQGDWLFKNGEPVSATIFYSTGEKWLVHSNFDDKGRLNGKSKEYEKDGTLKAIRYYKNNVMEKRRRVSRWLRWWWSIW